MMIPKKFWIPWLVAFILSIVFLRWSIAGPLDEFDKEFTPPYAFTVYSYKENNDWTTWNKALFSSAILTFGVGDIYSTKEGLDRGCVEANPLFGDDPSVGAMVLAKTAFFGLAWWATEYSVEKTGNTDRRNWTYGIISLLGAGVTAHNSSINCY